MRLHPLRVLAVALALGTGCSSAGNAAPPTPDEAAASTVRERTTTTMAAVTTTVDPMTEWIDVDTSTVPIEVPEMRLARDPDAMSPGLTLFNLVNTSTLPGFATQGEAALPGLLLAVDTDGRVVWSYSTPEFIGDARVNDDGSIVYVYGDAEAHEIDRDGRLLRRWVARQSPPAWTDVLDAADVPTVRVDTDSLHHEVQLLANGNLLALSSELRTLALPEPRCGEDPASYTGSLDLIGDVIVEVTPQGELVREISLFDLLDPGADPERRRVCGPFLVGRVFPISAYDEGGTRRVIDWTHANGVVLDEERNALIVSVRHLSALLAIRYEDDADGPAGELLWEIGPGGDVEVQPGTVLPSFQHAPEVQADGSILLYDNGNELDPALSRSVLLETDGTTVRQVWDLPSTIDGVDAFSLAVGDADRLENGNVLTTSSFFVGLPRPLAARIDEVVPDAVSGGRTVFDLRIDGGADGWFVYRAQRVPTDWLR